MSKLHIFGRTALLIALLAASTWPAVARAEDGASGSVESGMDSAGNATKRGLSRAGEAVGEALDTAITKTGKGVSTVLEKTGNGIQSAGKAISGEPAPEVHEHEDLPPSHHEPIQEENLDE